MNETYEPAKHVADWCDRFVRAAECLASTNGRKDMHEIALLAYIKMSQMVPEKAAVKWAGRDTKP